MMLKTIDLGMTYPSSDRILFDKINLNIKRKDLFCITGPSGSGKSTLLAILGGYLKPVKGEVWYCGKELGKLNDEELSQLHRTEIGYVPQSNVMLKRYTVLENIMTPYMIGGSCERETDLKSRASKYLERLGLDTMGDRYPHELSGGELKRVSIARAVLIKPRILIADEPTTGLDGKTSDIIMTFLREYVSDSSAVIIATHDENAIKYSTSRMALDWR